MIVYHYTTKEAYTQILKSREILQSDPLTTMDAAYGKGWYFTELKPDQCKAWTVAYCWRSLDVFEKVDCYLEFDIPDHLLKKCRDHVYMLNVWYPQIKHINGGETPKCSKGSCFVCSVIATVRSFLSR
jgi:hypothetical protein